MAYKISEIEGIGLAYAEKLGTAGIATTDDLLQVCCDARGRKLVSEKTGIGESVLLKWTNLADLMRISGVGSQFSELLEAAGVDTVRELATRNAENLAAAMAATNEEKKLARVSPVQTVVQGWIDQAKKLDAVISH